MDKIAKRIEIKDKEINFVCLKEKCPESCCGPFGGVQKGLYSVEDIDFSEIALTDEDYKRVNAEGLAYLIELSENGYYKMKLHPDGSCQAFIDGKCSIHSVRPTLCRAFPFYVDMFVGLCGVAGTCPGFGEGWTDIKDLAPEIDAAKVMYEFWLSQIGQKYSSEQFGEK